MTEAEMEAWRDYSPNESDTQRLNSLFAEEIGSYDTLPYTIKKASVQSFIHHSYLYLISMSPAQFAKLHEGILQPYARAHFALPHFDKYKLDTNKTYPGWWTPPEEEYLHWISNADYCALIYDEKRQLLYFQFWTV